MVSVRLKKVSYGYRKVLDDIRKVVFGARKGLGRCQEGVRKVPGRG